MKHVEETFVHSLLFFLFFSFIYLFNFLGLKEDASGVELQLSGRAFELFGQRGFMRVWTFRLPGERGLEKYLAFR